MLKDIFSEKVTRWIFFGVILSTLPILFTIFLLKYAIGEELAIAIRHGEVFILSTSIFMTSASEVFVNRSFKNKRRIRIACGSFTLILGLFCALLFAAAASVPLFTQEPLFSDDDIVAFSIYLFASSVAFSFACIVLSEESP